MKPPNIRWTSAKIESWWCGVNECSAPCFCAQMLKSLGCLLHPGWPHDANNNFFGAAGDRRGGWQQDSDTLHSARAKVKVKPARQYWCAPKLQNSSILQVCYTKMNQIGLCTANFDGRFAMLIPKVPRRGSIPPFSQAFIPAVRLKFRLPLKKGAPNSICSSRAPR